jgi:hypothetical protein
MLPARITFDSGLLIAERASLDINPVTQKAGSEGGGLDVHSIT